MSAAALESLGVLWLCADCMLAHAGFDAHEIGHEPEREPLGQIPSGVEITAGLLSEDHAEDCPNHYNRGLCVDCECERWEFTWSGCEGCGSPLGGERHAFTTWSAESR